MFQCDVFGKSSHFLKSQFITVGNGVNSWQVNRCIPAVHLATSYSHGLWDKQRMRAEEEERKRGNIWTFPIGKWWVIPGCSSKAPLLTHRIPQGSNKVQISASLNTLLLGQLPRITVYKINSALTVSQLWQGFHWRKHVWGCRMLRIKLKCSWSWNQAV